MKNNHKTTYRQSTGQSGRDFEFYPVVRVTPDASGTLEVDWSWQRLLDGAMVDSANNIVNTFPNLIVGQAANLQLLDNRPANTRNGSIALGDVDFVALGKQDGQWHGFEADINLLLKSASGASVNLSGKLGPENFKSIGALVNLISNPSFSNGFNGWGGYTGWTGSNGYAFLDNSIYHSVAPSLKLECDPRGITPNDPACWVDPRIPINGAVTLRAGAWVRADSSPIGYGGARMMVDFYDAQGNNLTNAGYFQILSCTVPVVDNCPVVAWGTNAWTLIEFLVKCTNSSAASAVPWLQSFPAQAGKTYSCWFDDCYCYLI